MIKMKKYNIIGINVTDRLKHVESIQKVLTNYGHDISTRLGLHNNKDDSPNGLILIEVETKSFKPISEELKKIEGIQLKSMRF